MALSNETTVAAGYLLDHAHLFQAILDMANGVTSVADMERAANEAEQRKSQAAADLDAVGSKIAEIQQRITDAEQALEEANSRATGIIDEATAEAERIKDAARQDADEAGRKAVAAADAEAERGRTAIAEANTELERLAGLMTEKQQQIADLEAAEADVLRRGEEARRLLKQLAEGFN